MLIGARGEWQRWLIFSEWNYNMSSEESEVEEETLKVKRYKVRSFAWESRELRRSKRKLDQSHQDSLPGLSKRVFIPREKGEPCNKPKPANCPD